MIMQRSNEKPGALAGASGADFGYHCASKDYRKPTRRAMSLFAQDRHKRACRMLGYALTANNPATWGQATLIFAHRLTGTELVSVAFSALSALDPDTREAVFTAAQWGEA